MRLPLVLTLAALAATLAPPPLRAQSDNAARGLAGADLLVGTLVDFAKNRLDFTGNKSFSADELRAPIAEQVREIQEKGLTPARADDAAFYVGTFYRKAGFSKASVEYEIRGDRLLIKIQEGARSLLRELNFVGNKSIPAATLYDYMIGATPERLAKEPKQFPYTAAEISAGADRVRGLYLSEGYLDVTVDATGVQLSDNETRASVTIRIVENTHYTFGEVGFAGDTLFSRAELVKALGEPPIGAFSPSRTNAMRLKLQSFYKTRGYYQADIAVTADPKEAVDGKVAVTFTIHPQSRFHFGRIEVRNETEKPRLKSDFLPKRFAHLQGEIYDPEKLDETFREMLRTGLFDNLRVTPVPEGTDQLRLDFVATEAKAKELGFTIGYGSYEGATAGFRIGDRDLFGRGRPLTFSADYSQRGLKGEILYVDPWLFDTRFALRVRVYSQTRDEEGYSKNEAGSRLDLTRKLMPHLELGVFGEAANVRVTGSTIDPALLGPTDYTLTTFGITQNTDYRNDPINPERGYVLTSAFDFGALDGEPGFLRGTVRFSYYQPLGRCLLGFGARAGYIAPLVDEIPIDIRFFNGGGTSVRSFAERELGPRDSHGNPLGGELYTVFNAELIFPLYGALQGATFVDAGSLRNKDVPGSGDLRYAVGLGLRYKLPIGPLRLDYGLNPDRRPGEDIGAFNFSFGFAF